MKSLLFITVLVLQLEASATAFLKPEQFTAAPEEVFLPQGFDSNDMVQVFFEGLFENACYKVGLTHHTVDQERKAIYITDYGHYFGHDFCAQVTDNYQKGVNAGILSKGDYRVFFRHSRGNFVEQGVLPVASATSDFPDDHLYAPVKSVQYHPGEDSSAGFLRINGQFTNTCMHLDQIKVVARPKSNVVDIL
ncbi:MAG: hypothetical protein AAF203_08475, partial [Pseudomonadota bacterium]